MPATRSRASRSPSLERAVILLTAAAFATATFAAAPVTSMQLAVNTPSPAAQQLADAAGDLAGAPLSSRARRPAALPPLPVGEIVVTVRVNGEDFGEAIVVQDADLGLLVERTDLNAWRVATPDTVIRRNDIEYIPLGEVPGLSHKFDRSTGVLLVTVEVAQFVREKRALYDLAMPEVTPPGFGAFANYDASYRESAGVGNTNGYLQLGAFSGIGVLTSDWAISETDTTRLNTTFTHDSLSSIATLRLGDFTGANSTFGGGLALGGLQWATNFATRPGLVPIPLQRLQGQVSVPSTVEVFVNGVPAYRTEVQPGPFTITDIPVVSGGGTVEMVITDALGRRQVVSNPFYATPTVLRGGFSEYSYEVGALRVPSATGNSLDYDIPVGRAVYRRGLTESFTGELQVEGSEQGELLGAAMAWLLPGGNGVLRFGAAASNDQTGASGALGLIGYELALQHFSVSMEAQHETAGFGRIGGLAPDLVHSRDLGQLVFGYNAATIGSLALALRRERNLSGGDASVSTLTWNRGFGGRLTLSFSTSYDAVSGNASAFANVAIPLGQRVSASLSHSVDRTAAGSESSQSTANLQRNLDTGPSWGYRVNAAQGGDAAVELAAQGESGTLRAGVTRSLGTDTSFATLSGSVALVGGSLHLSRHLGDGFALVRVPGAEGIGVYADNAYIGRTDADGERLLPNIIPYRPVRVSLDARDLPLEVQLKTDTLKVTVPYRAAATLDFPADLTRAYTAALVRRDGKPVPAGAKVWFDDATEPEPIGSDGFVYLTLNPGPHTLSARWADKACVVHVNIAPDADPQPDLGKLVCEEVAP